MYAHPAFKIHHAVGLAFAAARGFGHVIACEGGRPVAALLPFHVMEANGRLPRVQFHVARPNPLAHLATKGGPWLIAVAGDDAYVSPHWYASAEQVPTWLYEAVQLCPDLPHGRPSRSSCGAIRIRAGAEAALGR
jgi:transcriptional regulator